MAVDKTSNRTESSFGVGNIIAIVILAAIVIFGGTLLGNKVSQKQADKQVAGEEMAFNPVVEKTIAIDGVDNKTALELLKVSHQVEVQESSVGSFVTSIDGTKNVDDKYWMFYVNDQLASSGADTYKSKTGEKIEWRYESLGFE